MQVQLMRVAGRDETVKEMIERLDQAVTAPNTVAIVDDVSRAAEDFGGQGKWAELVQVMDRMHHHYDHLHDGDAKRAFLVGIRRLQRPVLLQGVARLLPGHRDMREMCTRVLSGAGEVGADVLIDNLIGSDISGERRAYLDALRQCPAAVNALLQAINDPSPDVRLHVIQAIASARNPRAVPWLIEALDHEQDPDIQGALVSALGSAPTEDGISRLIRAAEAGGLLLRKPAPMRIRAIEALADANTPSARQALQELASDRDRDVRAAVENAMKRLSA